MRKVLLLALALAAFAGLTATAGGAPTEGSLRWDNPMTPKQEVPPPKLGGFHPLGEFVIFYDPDTRVLTWMLRFGSTTGPVTAAHIHRGKVGVAGPVIVPLCGPCSSPSAGTIRLSPAQGKRFLAAATSGTTSNAYVNAHTRKNPAGEIRGQLVMPQGQGCAPC